MDTPLMPIAVKRCPRPNEAFVSYVKLIVSCLLGNLLYANCTPSAATLEAQANALAEANVKARTKTPSLVADRNAKRKHLEAELDHLVDFIRSLVNTQALDPATAITMILGAGLSVRKSGKSSKAPLAARHGIKPGEVWLVARAVAPTAVYFWESSLDQNVWSSLPETMRAKTQVSDLVPGQVYYFRVRARTRKGLGAYSEVVRLMAI